MLYQTFRDAGLGRDLPTLPAFVARGPVYALDLIGEPGRSEQTAPIRNADDQAAWLDTVFTTLALRDVHLVKNLVELVHLSGRQQ